MRKTTVLSLLVGMFLLHQGRTLKMRQSVKVLDSRMTALEMRVTLEAAKASDELSKLAEDIADINATVLNTGDNCAATADDDSVRPATDKRRNTDRADESINQSLLSAFKHQKTWLQNQVENMGQRLSDVEVSLGEALKTNVTEFQNKVELHIDTVLKEMNTSLINWQAKTGEQLLKFTAVVDKHSDTVKAMEASIEDIKQAQSKTHKMLESVVDFMLRDGCDKDWVRHEQFCYRVISPSASCPIYGAFLVDVQSSLEMTYLEDLSDHKTFMVGLSHVPERNTWVWARTKEQPVFVNWAKGEPSKRGSCVIAYKHSGWVVVDCLGLLFNSICKKAVKFEPTLTANDYLEYGDTIDYITAYETAYETDYSTAYKNDYSTDYVAPKTNKTDYDTAYTNDYGTYYVAPKTDYDTAYKTDYGTDYIAPKTYKTDYDTAYKNDYGTDYVAPKTDYDTAYKTDYGTDYVAPQNLQN